MALDAATLALTAAELRTALVEARIDKIYQPTRDEVVLALRSRTAGMRLLLSARSGSARVCLTTEIYENPAMPPSFCMLLRKHLGGGKVVDVRTLPGERIVFLDFICVNEMGDLVLNTLAAELMGRYSNLVIVARGAAEASLDRDIAPVGNKIVDALKRVDFEDSPVRQLLPGLPYTLPPMPPNLDFMTATKAEFVQRLAAAEAPVTDALRKMSSGVGPVVVRQVCFCAFGGQDPVAASMTRTQLDALWAEIEALRKSWADGGTPNLVLKPDGTPAEFSFTPLTQYLPSFTLVEYPSYSQLLEGYYAQKDRVERLRQKGKQLRKNLHNMYERAVRKQAARKEELAESGRSEGLRVAGELLTANLHAFARGDKQVTLLNWYTGQEQTISLDVRLSPSANAQKYFKEYKKKQTAAQMLEKLLAQGEREIEYLQTVLYEVEAATKENELEEVRAELKGQGYLKHYKPRDKRQKPADYLRYQSEDGFLILVGRNNLQNERLSLKTARGKDLWFHVKNAPGSHVVVMSEGKDIPLATQNQAAMLAVVHSSQKNSAKVPVDYTQVKHLRKTGDLPPGMVLYDHYETAYITPEEDKLPTEVHG